MRAPASKESTALVGWWGCRCCHARVSVVARRIVALVRRVIAQGGAVAVLLRSVMTIDKGCCLASVHVDGGMAVRVGVCHWNRCRDIAS